MIDANLGQENHLNIFIMTSQFVIKNNYNQL